jgi:hypothetical protein
MEAEPFEIPIPEELSTTFARVHTQSVAAVARSAPVVEAPTGVGVFEKEVVLMPRRWAERYYDLRRWTVMPRGGHFAVRRTGATGRGRARVLPAAPLTSVGSIARSSDHD